MTESESHTNEEEILVLKNEVAHLKKEVAAMKAWIKRFSEGSITNLENWVIDDKQKK